MITTKDCYGDEHAIAFIKDAYIHHNAFDASQGLQRLRSYGIGYTGWGILYHDCCGDDTAMTIDVMCHYNIRDIINHIQNKIKY